MTNESGKQHELELIQKLTSWLSEDEMPLPYLFLGSGISLRYLGLPNWKDLMVQFVERVNGKPHYELSKAESRLEKVATNIAERFHDVWFNDEQYERQRQSYPEIMGAENVLKAGVSEYLLSRQNLLSGTPGVDDPNLASEIEILRHAKIDGIITTNYDELAEQIFSDLPVFIGQSDLLLGKAQFIGEIYKIHGSVKDPISLVLTAQDYDILREKNPYLVAKLLTIFAEHPIIFAGYSIEDEYIQSLLVELVKAVGEDKLKQLAKRFYFVAYNDDPNSVPTIKDQLTVRGSSVIPMTVIETHSYEWIWKSLSELHRPIPTNFIRSIREQIYEIVRNPSDAEVRDKVYAIPFGEGGEEIRFVYGFGAFTEEQIKEINRMGAEPIAGSKLRREDVLKDILGIENGLNAKQVLELGIPDHIEPQSNEYIPLHKYLWGTGRLVSGEPDLNGLQPIIGQLLKNVPQPYKDYERAYNRYFGSEVPSFNEIFATEKSFAFKMHSVVSRLRQEAISEDDLESLRLHLVESYEEAQVKRNLTSFRMAVVAYSQAKWK